jgi:hypothetical protein
MLSRRRFWHGTKSLLGLDWLYGTRYAPFIHGAALDCYNRLRFGADAPRFAERLWIDPRTVLRYDRKGTVWRSGLVVTGVWPAGDEKPIATDPILQTSIAHWVDGKSWEESGEVARMEETIRKYPGTAGCYTRDDILQRCARLDEIFHVVEREGRVRSMAELDSHVLRELGGIGMHIGPDGALIRAGHGRHRFAIAWILGIPTIPVRVGMVHRSALALVRELRHAPGTGEQSAAPRERRLDRPADGSERAQYPSGDMRTTGGTVAAG